MADIMLIIIESDLSPFWLELNNCIATTYA